jgi:hypothetical protein
MVDVTFTIPDEEMPRVLAAFSNFRDFSESGLTEAQWARRCVMNYVRDTVRDYERNQARIVALSTVTDINPN